ncbi:MAG: hypothetical protein PGN11_15725 [Quadrisphaera sp.]
MSLERSLPRGQVSRDDVRRGGRGAAARTGAAAPEEDPVLELMSGDEPVDAAVARS